MFFTIVGFITVSLLLCYGMMNIALLTYPVIRDSMKQHAETWKEGTEHGLTGMGR